VYKEQKAAAAEVLFKSIGIALDIDVKEVKERSEVSLIGSPLTHERFLRRKDGTYGAVFNEMLPGPETPLKGLYLAGDSVFPGIGVPAVAVSGASAANTAVNVVTHLRAMMTSKTSNN